MKKPNRIRETGLANLMHFGNVKLMLRRHRRKPGLTFLSFRTSWEGVQMRLKGYLGERFKKNNHRSTKRSKILKVINYIKSFSLELVGSVNLVC